MPCPRALKEIIEFVNQVPVGIELLGLAKLLPNLDDEFLRFLKMTSGIEDVSDEVYRGLRPRSMKDWVDRLLELHRVMTWALREFPKHLRVNLWQEALMPQQRGDGNYGPNGQLSHEGVQTQHRLARDLAPRLANDPLETSLSFLSQFAGKSQDNARLYFWALFGLAKRYFLLEEYRANLDKVMKIAELNPNDRLTFSEVLYRIVISQEYSVDERGNFIQLRNPFTDALEDEKVDVTRIRSCDNCKTIFWAGRKDQICCTRACNHARHSRRTREKYRQGYYQGNK